MKTATFLGGASLAATALAQQSAWGQCGGTGWSGQTTCVSGYVCTVSSPYYSQCVPGTASGGGSPTTLQTSTTSAANGAGATTAHFKWFGVDESGAEFGQQNIPGVYGTDFIFPDNTALDTLMGQGFNIFRVPFLMERMVPTELTGAVWADYLTNYTATINHITGKGAYAVVDPHNFGRYYGNIITDTTGFQAFWKTVATAFKGNSKVIFDTNNEYHDMDETLVLNLNQAAINGIRGAGATTQYIFAEGNSYSAAMYWNTTSDNLKGLTDPQDLLVYEMHQYLDSDNSGTSATCVSGTVGVERVSGATAWLRANGKLGIIGETAGGANSVCMQAVTGMVQHLKDNDDVWMGMLWWGGGPWWGTYLYSFEPPSGTGYTYYDSTLVGLM